MAEFDKLTDTKLWRDAVFVAIGFALPEVLRRLVEQDGVSDFPDEVYGLVVMLGAYMIGSGRTARMWAVGAGFYTLAKLLARFGVIQPLTLRAANGTTTG